MFKVFICLLGLLFSIQAYSDLNCKLVFDLATTHGMLRHDYLKAIKGAELAKVSHSVSKHISAAVREGTLDASQYEATQLIVLQYLPHISMITGQYFSTPLDLYKLYPYLRSGQIFSPNKGRVVRFRHLDADFMAVIENVLSDFVSIDEMKQRGQSIYERLLLYPTLYSFPLKVIKRGKIVFKENTVHRDIELAVEKYLGRSIKEVTLEDLFLENRRSREKAEIFRSIEELLTKDYSVRVWRSLVASVILPGIELREDLWDPQSEEQYFILNDQSLLPESYYGIEKTESTLIAEKSETFSRGTLWSLRQNEFSAKVKPTQTKIFFKKKYKLPQNND